MQPGPLLSWPHAVLRANPIQGLPTLLASPFKDPPRASRIRRTTLPAPAAHLLALLQPGTKEDRENRR